jgi:hypothetical protein
MADRVAVGSMERVDNDNDDIDDSAYTYMNIARGEFDRVVLDEGQKAKNVKSKIHRTVFNMLANYHWIVTATPLMNSSSDLHGPLTLLFRNSMSLDEYTSGEESLAPKHFNRENRPKIMERLGQKFGQYGTKIQGWGKSTSMPLFLLDPVMFARMASQNKLRGSLGKNILSSILDCIQLKVTMATPVVINGQEIRVGSNIKPYRTTVVELDTSDRERAMLKNIFDLHYPLLYQGAETSE